MIQTVSVCLYMCV